MVALICTCRTSDSRTGCGETWRSRISPRNLRSLYFGSTSDEENGWKMWPKKPRFCKVVVVIGVVVGTGVAVTGDVVADGVVSGVPEGSGVVSWADRSPAAARSM